MLIFVPNLSRSATIQFEMKINKLFAIRALLVLAGVFAAVPTPAQTGTGSIEFTVAASPSGGRPQNAPLLPIYLLTKSYAEIRSEAEKETPPVDLNAFVDSLDLSPEMKEWMKKKKTARLSGQDFNRLVATDDVMKVPEFWEAYLTRNAQDVNVGFPRAKFKISDPTKNPEQYDAERKEYRERVRKYLTSYQHTKEGIDLHLTSVDPGQRWARKELDRQAEIAQLVQRLSQSKYLVARGETDLQGRGAFVRVSPGEFWLSTLDHEAVAGDVRLRWDLPVRVQAGTVTRIELSNVNSLPRARRP